MEDDDVRYQLIRLPGPDEPKDDDAVYMHGTFRTRAEAEAAMEKQVAWFQRSGETPEFEVRPFKVKRPAVHER
jgi:hypothetical protein